MLIILFFFFSSRRRHTRCSRDWSSDVCSSDLFEHPVALHQVHAFQGNVQPRILQIAQKHELAAMPVRLDLAKSFELPDAMRSEEHTSELQSRLHLVCRLLLENKKTSNLPPRRC